MTTRILLSGRLKSAIFRRRRKSDGALFGICRIDDRDRMEVRVWTVYVNDPDVIDQLEELRVGEPIAIVGPFSGFPSTNGQGIDWKISAEAVLDVKRKKKSKTAKGREERARSDEIEDAPKVLAEEPFHDDALPF